jgi:DNA-binding NarL/FixJ family response regulator/class 3 adenylate cyclase
MPRTQASGGAVTTRAAKPTPPSASRGLVTVVFTDIDGSTEMAERLGDRQWQKLLTRHDSVARKSVDEYGGRTVKSVGDGVVAVFDTPGAGVAWALSMAAGASALGVSIRAGVHTGEVDVVPGDLAGIAVHVASRVCDLAEAGSVLVTSTVKDLAMGGDFTFTSQGSHTLRGVSRRWRLFEAAARDGHDVTAAPSARSSRSGTRRTPAKATGTRAAAKPDVRVVIADDHPLWRATLRQVLERSRGFRIVGEAADGAEAIKITQEEKPDVVLLDMEMPSVHGIDVAREIVAAAVGSKFLVLSSHEDRETVLAAVEAGATGYLLKTADAGDIRDAVRRVAAGEIVFPAAQAEFVLGALRSRPSSDTVRGAERPGKIPAALSKREGEVLQLMAQGLTNQAIAQRLVVSLKTVESHVSSIFTKLEIPPTDDLHRRVTAVVAFITQESTS